MCRHVAKGKDVVRAIDGKRLFCICISITLFMDLIFKDSLSFLNASFRSLLRSYILSLVNDTPSPFLISLLEPLRVKFIYLSYLGNASGMSLLHEAARHKDLRLIELAVRTGADVFVRNQKGKMAYEGSRKDDPVRAFLRQCSFSTSHHENFVVINDYNCSRQPRQDTDPESGAVDETTGAEGLSEQIYEGYNTRWFVLKSVLSCMYLSLLFGF